MLVVEEGCSSNKFVYSHFETDNSSPWIALLVMSLSKYQACHTEGNSKDIETILSLAQSHKHGPYMVTLPSTSIFLTDINSTTSLLMFIRDQEAPQRTAEWSMLCDIIALENEHTVNENMNT